MNLRDSIDQRPMGGYQWLIVALCTLLNALDGFDVLAMAFTAQPVTEDFGLNGSQLGLLLSAGLIGMAVGSLVLSPLADRIGRRPLLLIALSLNCAGLFLSATAGSAVELGIWRVLTGLGVGGILASATVLTSEYSNRRRRGLTISIFTAGYGVGATLGGLAAARLITSVGWHSVFLLGGVLTLVAIALVALLLPESVDYLATGRGRKPLERAQSIASRLRFTDIDFDPPTRTVETSGAVPRSRASVLDGTYRIQSLLLWLSFFAIMFGFYFANSWTPKLLAESGMTQEQGIIGGLMLTMGGTFGSLLFGVLTLRWSAKSVQIVFVVLSAVTLVAFITTTAVPAIAFLSGVIVGMLINGCVAGLYTLAPAIYEPSLRTTGVGWGIGVGRAGAILAPIVVGALLDAGWSPTALYTGVAVVVLAAAAAVAAMRPTTQSRREIAVEPEPVESSPSR